MLSADEGHFLSAIVGQNPSAQAIGEGKKIDVLNEYIERQFDLVLKAIEAMPPEQAKSWEKVNDLFLLSLDTE